MGTSATLGNFWVDGMMEVASRICLPRPHPRPLPPPPAPHPRLLQSSFHPPPAPTCATTPKY
eukprot:3931274-Rhodomonas_salina.1